MGYRRTDLDGARKHHEHATRLCAEKDMRFWPGLALSSPKALQLALLQPELVSIPVSLRSLPASPPVGNRRSDLTNESPLQFWRFVCSDGIDGDRARRCNIPLGGSQNLVGLAPVGVRFPLPAPNLISTYATGSTTG